MFALLRNANCDANRVCGDGAEQIDSRVCGAVSRLAVLFFLVSSFLVCFFFPLSLRHDFFSLYACPRSPEPVGRRFLRNGFCDESGLRYSCLVFLYDARFFFLILLRVPVRFCRWGLDFNAGARVSGSIRFKSSRILKKAR